MKILGWNTLNQGHTTRIFVLRISELLDIYHVYQSIYILKCKYY